MLKSRLLISLAVLSCLLFNASLSHDCLAGFYDKHSANDVKHLMVKANAGDRIAQEELAGVYQSGEGIAKSEDKAVIWYKKAALQGCASSQRLLAYHYLTAKDYKNAFYWLEKSAKAGDKVAQLRLGVMYAKGNEGVVKNGKQAVYWFEKSAQQKFPIAIMLVSGLYKKGELVEKNEEKADQWLDKGASEGDYALRDIVAQRYFEKGGFYWFKGVYWRTLGWLDLIKCLVEGWLTGFKSMVKEAESHLDPTCANQPQ